MSRSRRSDRSERDQMPESNVRVGFTSISEAGMYVVVDEGGIGIRFVNSVFAQPR